MGLAPEAEEEYEDPCVGRRAGVSGVVLEWPCFLVDILGSLGDPLILLVAGSLGDPRSLQGPGLAGLPAEMVDGDRGVLAAADVTTLESSRGGVPTVKSLSKAFLLEDCRRRCSKAL